MSFARTHLRVFSSRVLRAGTALLLASTCVLGVVSMSPLHAQTEPDRALEQRVKAAFLYRFTEFVVWPDTAFTRADAPVVIAVAGADEIADQLRSITAGRSVAGRSVEVKRVEASEPMPAAHMLFISGADRTRARELLRAAPRNVLVVTETEGALEQGSVINFVIADGKVRFDISLESAEKRGLRLSSRLLAVARTVRGNP